MSTEFHRIVLKIGSSSLNHAEGGVSEAAIQEVAQVIARLNRAGMECVLVSSGAVAAGMGKLGFVKRPRDIAGKQAAAAVGQGVLIEKYAQAFERHGLTSAQVLLSRMDLAEVSRYRNAQNTLERLLHLGTVPIINENDTVVVEELCFGDNDRLSALVAGLVHADFLIILTDVDGLYTANPKSDPTARRMDEVRDIAEVMDMAGDAGSNLGTGGMVTKLKAAEIATRFGIGMLLLNASRLGELENLLAGKRPLGTYFVPSSHRLSGRKRWIAYAGLSEGSIIVDDGAEKALALEGKSLLASGIIGVEGGWERKELVRILNQDGQEIARGLAELSSTEVDAVKGLHSEEMLARISGLDGGEVIHRDNLTLMGDIGAK
ncbi:MAG: glutamate 5-kinase [Desulfitobacteriaceae bacterium]|nr:glutamate 5-kinase [Desulfitobacteriaceae bacterium]MDI6879611.1 glutamate 5-kinase [Desulfitobacteriaceae bacterium]MDI6915393.1 glutamate 5-kinase [Desulfitobacteriaceae bacterium]